jgi:hypothetical protein
VSQNQRADAHEVYLQMLTFVGDAPEARQAIQDVWNEEIAILNQGQSDYRGDDNNGSPVKFWKIHKR